MEHQPKPQQFLENEVYFHWEKVGAQYRNIQYLKYGLVWDEKKQNLGNKTIPKAKENGAIRYKI